MKYDQLPNSQSSQSIKAASAKPRIRQKGFTLIEVLVALVILSASFAAVWAWLNTSSNTTQKIATRIALQEATEQFVDYLSVQDLQKNASGSFALKEYVFEYQASIQRRSDAEAYRKQPQWIVALFDVDIQVYKTQPQPTLVSEHQTSQVRYWRDPNHFDPSELLGIPR